MADSQGFWSRFPPFQLWRFLVLNVKVLRGVDRSKRLPRFVMKYKVSYLVPGADVVSAIATTSKPPQVGDVVALPGQRVQIEEVHQVTRPRGEFCFLEAICREI